MKIDKPSNPLPASQASDSSTVAKGRVNQTPTATTSSTTNVSLGSTATQLNSMEKAMAAAPVVNASKVAEIKQAISEGRFKVNPEAVAGKLIATVRELIGGKAQ